MSLIPLHFEDLAEPTEAEHVFIGGSLDGQTKRATLLKKIDPRFSMTLKNGEIYRFEEPNIMRFAGMKEIPSDPFAGDYVRVHSPNFPKMYVPRLQRLGRVRHSRRGFKRATDAVHYAHRWAEKATRCVPLLSATAKA